MNQLLTGAEKLVSVSKVFKMEYSLRYKEVTDETTPDGFFHGLVMLVVAGNEADAVKFLHRWHNDGQPHAVKITELDICWLAVGRAVLTEMLKSYG